MSQAAYGESFFSTTVPSVSCSGIRRTGFNDTNRRGGLRLANRLEHTAWRVISLFSCRGYAEADALPRIWKRETSTCKIPMRKHSQPPDCKDPPRGEPPLRALSDILRGKTRTISTATSRIIAAPWWRPIIIPKTKAFVKRFFRVSQKNIVFFSSAAKAPV